MALELTGSRMIAPFPGASICATVPASAMLSGLYASLGTAFPIVKVFPVDGSGDALSLQNIILAAYKSADEHEKSGMVGGEYKEMSYHIPAFTDNFAPVERYTLEMPQVH